MLAPALSIALCVAAAHPNSLSGSTLAVEGARVGHEISMQGLSLIEVLPDADADGDGRLSPAELEGARADVIDYLDRNYRLWSDVAREHPLEREVLSVEVVAPPPGLFGPPDPWVRVRSRFDADAPIEALSVEMRLFIATSPDHRDFIEVHWDGERAFATSLSQFEPDASFLAEDLPFLSWLEWLWLGARGLLSSRDRLAFLLALFLAVPAARGARRVALGYGLSQSLGFVVAAAGLVALPERFLGLSIALAAAFCGAQLLTRREPRAMVLEALVFGALGGLAFGRDALKMTAGFLKPGAPRTLLGIGELLALVLLVAVGVAIVARARKTPVVRLGKGTLAAAALVTLFGLYRFVRRAGWL